MFLTSPSMAILLMVLTFSYLTVVRHYISLFTLSFKTEKTFLTMVWLAGRIFEPCIIGFYFLVYFSLIFCFGHRMHYRVVSYHADEYWWVIGPCLCFRAHGAVAASQAARADDYVTWQRQRATRRPRAAAACAGHQQRPHGSRLDRRPLSCRGINFSLSLCSTICLRFRRDLSGLKHFVSSDHFSLLLPD